MADVKISQLPAVMTVQATDLTVVSEPAGLVYTSKKMNLAQLKLFISQLTTKGDLLTYSTENTRLPVGASSTLLRVNSSTSTGLEWGPTLTKLATGFSLADGTVLKTLTLSDNLTVTAACTIDQNLQTTAAVTFANGTFNGAVTISKASSGGHLADQLTIQAPASGNDRLEIGIDSTNEKGCIQAKTDGAGAYLPLLLQQSGGNVGIGLSATQTPNAKLHGNTSTILGLANTAVADGNLYNGNINIWLDESSPDLNFKTKNSAGVIRTFTIPSTVTSLWEVTSTNWLAPLRGDGYIGIRLFESTDTDYVEITYHDLNNIYYNSNNASAIHRFWQTLQAETYIKLNNSGALSTINGINLSLDSANIRFGNDSGNIRTNLADNTKSFIWSSGTIGSATDAASLTAAGVLTTTASVNASGDLDFTNFPTTVPTGGGFVVSGIIDPSFKLGIGSEIHDGISSSANTIVSYQTGTPDIFSELDIYASYIFLQSGTNPLNWFQVGQDISAAAESYNFYRNGSAFFNLRSLPMNIIMDTGFNNPQFTISGASNSNEQLRLSYDTSIGVAVWEAKVVGTSWVPTYYDASSHFFQINGSGISGAYDSTGFHTDNISEITNGHGVVFGSNTNVAKDNAQMSLTGATNNTKHAWFILDTTLNLLDVQIANTGVSFYPIKLSASSLVFNMGTGTPSVIGQVDSTGLSINQINEYTASNGVRIANKTSIGSTSAPTAQLSGFGSTFIGVSSATYGTSALAAEQMEIWCDQSGPGASWTLNFVRKGSDGTTIKTATLTMS